MLRKHASGLRVSRAADVQGDGVIAGRGRGRRLTECTASPPPGRAGRLRGVNAQRPEHLVEPGAARWSFKRGIEREPEIVPVRLLRRLHADGVDGTDTALPSSQIVTFQPVPIHEVFTA